MLVAVFDFNKIRSCWQIADVNLLGGFQFLFRDKFAQHIGHSVAGDRLYGDDPFNQEMAARGLKRLFLHAASIGFDVGGRRVEVAAPLPSDLIQLLNELRAPP